MLVATHIPRRVVSSYPRLSIRACACACVAIFLGLPVLGSSVRTSNYTEVKVGWNSPVRLFFLLLVPPNSYLHKTTPRAREQNRDERTGKQDATERKGTD